MAKSVIFGGIKMNFEEILPNLKEGKLVRRLSWSNEQDNVYLYFDKLGCLWKRSPQKRYTKSELYVLRLKDINASDWEVMEE